MICFAWCEYPQYGARCVGAFVRSTDEEVVVVATKPRVPVSGMDELSGCRVVWLEANEHRTLREILGDLPRAMLVSGWGIDLFNRFSAEVRRNGGRVIAGCDNNFDLSLKSILKAVRFRLFLKKRYDGFWVPGISGDKLLRLYGVPVGKRYVSSYAADASLFQDGGDLTSRLKRILFVGQINERKNIVPFCEAFLSISESKRNGWQVEVCGCGPLRDKIPADPAIIVHDFVQPELLAGVYRQVRCFVLPSVEEHWGLVVHEAALSGCILLLSDTVGAKEDFLSEGENGYSFPPLNRMRMRQAIEQVMSLEGDALEKARMKSLQLSQNISVTKFVSEMHRFIDADTKER